MKAFVVLALVAVAAARSVDVDPMHLLMKEKPSLLKGMPTTNRFTVPRRELSTVPGYGYGYDEPTYFAGQVTVVPLEELVHYPLFNEYYRIPLFRQFYEQYPVVFRRYVESPFFQRFWTFPEFQTYFRNPVLFYTYIYPQIQIIAERVVGPTYNRPSYEEEYYKRPVYGQGEPIVGDYLSRFFGRDVESVSPYVYGGVQPYTQYDRQVNFRDFWNRIFRQGVEGQYPVHREGYYYPTNFHQYQQYNPVYGPYNPIFGRRYGHVNEYSTRNLLNKIYRHMYINKPNQVVGDVTDIVTDVKVAPIRREVVEPITGQTQVVTEPRVVDVSVDQHVSPSTEVPTTVPQTEREITEHFLRRLLVSGRITYETYRFLHTLPLYQVREYLHKFDPTIVVDPTFSRYFPEEYRFPTHHREVPVPSVEDIIRPRV